MFCADAIGCVAGAVVSQTGSVNFVAGAAFQSSASVARRKRTLCGDRSRRSALAVAPCEFVLSSANPPRRLWVSKRSRCECGLNPLWRLCVFKNSRSGAVHLSCSW